MVFVLQKRETEKSKVRSRFFSSYLKEIFVEPSCSGHLFGEVAWLLTTSVTHENTVYLLCTVLTFLSEVDLLRQLLFLLF